MFITLSSHLNINMYLNCESMQGGLGVRVSTKSSSVMWFLLWGEVFSEKWSQTSAKQWGIGIMVSVRNFDVIGDLKEKIQL